jgi:unconventional prefoldin RPB5 interactor 1
VADQVDLSRPVSLVTDEDRQQSPVTDVDESTEDAKLRREMFQYGINEVGAIVAELEMDEDASDVSFEEDYEYETDEDEDEDEFGRSYTVLSEDYHQQMRALEAKLNARGMWNMGKDSQSLPADVRKELDAPAAEHSRPENGILDGPVKEKKPKKRVAFADDLDIAPAPDPPVAEKILPPQADVTVLSDSIVERTDRSHDTRPAATDAPKKASRFKSARGAGNESDLTDNTPPGMPIHFAESRATRKQTNAAPASVPPPLFPATPKEPKPFSTPITDIPNIPSVPQPPEGKTLADNLVERDIAPGIAAPPEADELNEEIHRREIATEFYKARNRLVQQNGRFVNDDEQEMVPIEDEDPPKRISKFKAARMR